MAKSGVHLWAHCFEAPAGDIRSKICVSVCDVAGNYSKFHIPVIGIIAVKNISIFHLRNIVVTDTAIVIIAITITWYPEDRK